MTDEPTSSNADARDDSSGPGRPNEDRSPTSASPAERPVVAASENSTTVAIDHAALANGREPDLAAYFEHSYRSPASAKVASRTLIDAFDDKGLWLASLIQPSHLARELAQNCSEVTRLVILQWVRQGETHKLKLLGETLLSVTDSQISQETTRMMMVLAGLLGILRPSTAQKLAARAVPRMPDTADVELVSDASRWVEAGVVLESSSTEERVFWNRRLREPDAGWDWDTTEARLALSHLAKVLPREGDLHELFQNAIPGCWWDLWREQSLQQRHLPTMPMLMAPGSSDTTAQPVRPGQAGSRRGSFKGGLAAGIAASVILGGVGLIVLADAEEDHRQRLSMSSSRSSSIKAGSQPQETRKTDSKNDAAAPPIRDSLRYLKAVLAGGGASAQSAGKATAGGSSDKKSPATLPALPNMSKKDLRERERVIFEHDHPEIQKLFSLLKDGSLRQHESLLQGESGAAPAGSTEHQQLLHWLLLDPPEQADTRLTATKLAMRDLPIEETVGLFDLCFYPGSPNEIEIRQCAGLLLDVSEELTSEQRAKLKAISESKT
jgi:hypothetical protein